LAGTPVRIGIFGGCFDPPHIGHFICARATAETLGLDRVLVIPAAIQPHKSDQAYAPPELRWEMVQAATAGDALFHPSRIEIDRGGLSYTVDTLRELARRWQPPEHQLYCLIGADALSDIDSWREPEIIFRLAQVVVMTRPGTPPAEAPSRWTEEALMLETPHIEISSTWVRERVAAGLPVEMMVGTAVEEIISRHNLYRG